MSLFDNLLGVLGVISIASIFIVPVVTDLMEKKRIARDAKRRALLDRVKQVTNADRNRLSDPRAQPVRLMEMAVDLCVAGLVAVCLLKRS